MVKVVLLSTSAADLKGHPTGVWLEEVATPYYLFKEAGYDVVLASISGGPVPIDQNSMGPGMFTEDSKKFMHDMEAVGAICHTTKLESIDMGDGVDALYMAGGHGTCVDFVSNPTLKNAIETLYASGKIVAADCHGPIALAECMKPDGITPLVKDLTVTGFADSEEEVVQLTSIVPFLVEGRFKELGAKYEKAEQDWMPKVCVDGNLVTGQNPASSEQCAKAVLELLSKN